MGRNDIDTEITIKAALALAFVGLCLLSTASIAQSDYRDRDDRGRYEERYEDRDRERRGDRYDDRRERYEDRYEERYDSHYEDRRRPSYSYCRDRAMDITGYRGPTPSRYRGGGALEGAIKGGAKTGVTSWALGGDKKQVRKARERGAKLGFIIGAIKEGQARERERYDDRLRRDYDYEVRRCMDGY